MADLIEISDLIMRTSKQLDDDMETMMSKIKKSASAEKNYRVALAGKIMRLRAEKMPVSLINDVARGDEKISGLKFNRDVETETYKATKEVLKARESQLSSLQTLIKYMKEVEGNR